MFNIKNFIVKLKFKINNKLERIVINLIKFRDGGNLEWLDFVAINYNRNKVYRRFQVKFYYYDPKWLRDHRNFFKQQNRGFGEDSFHSYWLSLLKSYKPSRLLEIGVYRGQTISLWALIAKELSMSIKIVGLSPLNNLGDSVSSYLDIDYKKDILKNFENFNLPKPTLVEGLSRDNINLIEGGNWDLIYVDGSHDYKDVKVDVEHSYSGLKVGGLLVLDDSSLYTDFKPLFSSAFQGHPGPSQVLLEMDKRKWKFVLGVGHNNIFQKLKC